MDSVTDPSPIEGDPPAAMGVVRRHAAFLLVAISCSVALAFLTIAYLVWSKRNPLVEGALAIEWGLHVLGCVSYPILRHRKTRALFPVVLLVWWIAFELCAAPFLVFTLSLTHYLVMQDVEHRPRGGGAGYNADFLYMTAEASEFHPDGINILFLGDSFTLGTGVKPREGFPVLIGDRFRTAHPNADIQIANLAWISSSPLLSYRRLMDIGDKYHPTIVVLCIDMTDFGDDIRYQHMMDRAGLYGLYDRIPITIRGLQLVAPDFLGRLVSWSVGGAPTKRFFITEAPLSETRRWFAPLVANVQKIREWSRARDADFLLVIMPRAYQYSDRESPNSWEKNEYVALGPHAVEPFRYFEELQHEVDYPIESLLEDFRSATDFPLYLDHDPHWNANGHKVAARGILRRLEPMLNRHLARSGENSVHHVAELVREAEVAPAMAKRQALVVDAE